MKSYKSLGILAISIFCLNTYAEVVNGKYFSGQDKKNFPGLYAQAKLQKNKIIVQTPGLDAIKKPCKIEYSPTSKGLYLKIGEEVKTKAESSLKEVLSLYVESVDKGLCHASLVAKTCSYTNDLKFVFGGQVVEQKFSSKEEALDLIKELSINKASKEPLDFFSNEFKHRNLCSRSFLEQELYKAEKEKIKKGKEAAEAAAAKAKKDALEADAEATNNTAVISN